MKQRDLVVSFRGTELEVSVNDHGTEWYDERIRCNGDVTDLLHTFAGSTNGWALYDELLDTINEAVDEDRISDRVGYHEVERMNLMVMDNLLKAMGRTNEQQRA